ncbi:hypothetical protein [Aestuariibacter salexigens]|uniref:hypothetical protein n=1 Tax=Aestuariibacter salexigens TaxID=226010 RepID=UPI00047EA285|nr:hypothetical protein [Aestuariibacter salexigens]
MKSFCTLVFVTCLLALPTTVSAAQGKKHFPGIFIGNTHFDGEDNFTLGLEYEYRFTPKWGLELIYERINDAHHGDGATVVVAQAMYHPVAQLRMGFGLGQERLGGAYQKNKQLYRATIAYDFLVGDIEIAPTISLDHIDGENAVVAGIAFIYPL